MFFVFLSSLLFFLSEELSSSRGKMHRHYAKFVSVQIWSCRNRFVVLQCMKFVISFIQSFMEMFFVYKTSIQVHIFFILQFHNLVFLHT